MELLKSTIEGIKPLNMEVVEKAKKHIDNLTKPIGSLGTLEEIGARMAGITGKIHNKINKKNIVIMAADNGVVDEGVSCAPKFITKVVTENFTRGITGVCVLARQAGAELTIVDIGVDADFDHPLIINKKIAYGTKNIAKEAAMSYEDAVKAIEIGIEVVDNLVKGGVDLLGTGEMGIGNTTTSAAVLSALSGLSPDVVVGKGAGLTDEQHQNKKNVVKRALEINKPNPNDPIDVIAKVGGFDIAGLCGCFLAAAKNRVPIVIDGFISSAAALCAVRLNPLVKDYIFPSHLSAEPGAVYMMNEIGIEPMLNLKMRLGEGSGCPLAFMIIESALAIVNEMGSFEEANIVNDFLVDIREEK
ncbi:Nicotinate-nucleotide--dimethylbenzimidazole phosphoribosyltransferase [Caloramator mitchellensis]|uniref:Nicotinate-nucleotide--dimethylbenzimidazole phosphoribosyltransferase n=1 Tax=Caloramator mitchellensis TaxID=908809 RepID=A0A0R3JYC6_CALMK|nr:nicotinate-nucleotide--dimethylbenzimidazole phosphoribosyltransferase [Caloramator mitchellensis]KRQ85932.1 Nicotinate-nucleotide--dimethylbenzimidazole phosphoribosyltransferase [Caloramator mitchellensis]